MEKTTVIKGLQNLQKHIGSEYYSQASDCTNPNLRIDFLSIAREESDIISWLDYEIDKKDEVEYPESETVFSAYEKYSSLLNNLKNSV